MSLELPLIMAGRAVAASEMRERGGAVCGYQEKSVVTDSFLIDDLTTMWVGVAQTTPIRTHDFDLIDDLHDALNVGDDLLCQLLLKERAELALKHQHASFGFAADASERHA